MELISNLFQFAVTLLGFCMSGMDSQRDFPLSSAIHPFLCRGKRLFDTEISDSSSDRRSALCILLYFWGCSLQSALVWHDDRCFLSFYPGSCLCADTDGNSV